MPFITREDGERFVIPSYRDVLAAKQKSQLKKEILLLSQSYGEYITLQRKNVAQYEVAFSSDTGYLLGESIWHQFKKPLDMIYCEALPNATEAILVIVKAGSVYLDGNFPLESIPEELIIFLSQQNNFEIYTYGDVPIAKEPTEGKFSFEANSVKSFTVLENPVFPTLPLLKIYQLQLVGAVLKSQGIGVFPTRQLVSILLFAALIYGLYSYLSSRPAPPKTAVVEHPYMMYTAALASPAPDEEITKVIMQLNKILEIPGWFAKSFKYAKSNLSADMVSNGGKVKYLFLWGENNNANVTIQKKGISLSTIIPLENRAPLQVIYDTSKVVAQLIDTISAVYPGNNFTVSDFVRTGLVTKVTFIIRLENASLVVLDLIGQQLKNLPIVLTDLDATIGDDNNLTGSITLEILGN